MVPRVGVKDFHALVWPLELEFWTPTMYLPYMQLKPNDGHYISNANKYGGSGTPFCRKFHYNPCPNDTRRIAIQQSGKFTSTRTHRHQPYVHRGSAKICTEQYHCPSSSWHFEFGLLHKKKNKDSHAWA